MRDPSGFDLLAAFLGTLGAILLLIAAFAAAAEELPPTTDPEWAAAAFVPSLVFGHFRERYGSIVPGTALHVFYNAGYFLLVAPRLPTA